MSLPRRVHTWTGGIGLWRKVAIALAASALASGIATYLALTGAPPFGPRSRVVLTLLNLDLVLLLALRPWSQSGWSRCGWNAGAGSPVRGCRSSWLGCSP